MSRDRRRKRGSPAGTGPGSEEERHPDRFIWIVDGHNAIFAVREWEDLQLAGRKRDARIALEESLEIFGRAAGAQVRVVYDGNHMERNPDAVDRIHLRSEYSQPPEEADDRIRFLVTRTLRDGFRPVVVTSDRKTLAASLPAGSRWKEVKDFFRGVHARWVSRPEKWDPGALDLGDVERYFLSRSPFEEDREAAGARPGEDEPERD